MSDVLDTGAIGDSFSTGSTAVTLTDVKLLLGSLGFSSTGTTSLDLLSDNSNSPGTQVAQLATFNNTILPTAGSFQLVDFPGLSVALSANTRYWIQLSRASASGDQDVQNTLWSTSSDLSGIGVLGEYNFVFGPPGIPNTQSPGPFQMKVTASSTQAVPEPSTMPFAILGFAAFVALRAWKCR